MNNMNIVETLINKNITISTAESFTGGLLSSSIVNMPHASNCFCGGVVAYTKEAKCILLDMSLKEIDSYSVYSTYTSRKMADGIMDITQSQIAIGTTGVAGPGDDEGVKEGTLFYTIKISDTYYDRCISLNLGRNENRIKACEIILDDLSNLINKL